MARGRSWSTLVAVLGSTALGLGLAACGGSKKVAGTTTVDPGHHTRTHATSTAGAGTRTVGSSTTGATTPGAGGPTTIGHSTTTRPGGSGSGSGGSSGGAGLSGDTTSTTTTTTSTTSVCKGQDCQTGSPTVPGSVPPVNGKCRSGYIYVAAQDGGPALCIPRETLTTSTTAATQ